MGPTEHDGGTTPGSRARTAGPPANDAVDPPPAPAAVPAGAWSPDPRFPHPATHATRAAAAIAARGAATAHRDLGVLAGPVETTTIGGRLCTRAVPLTRHDAAPGWRFAVLVRAVPALRRRTRAARRALAADLPGELLQRWWHEWRPALADRTTVLRATDPAALDDHALLRHLDDVLALVEEGGRLHTQLLGAGAVVLDGYLRAAYDLLGWDEGRSLALLAGTSSASIAASRALDELAGMAARTAPVRAAIDRDAADAAALLAREAGFAGAVARFLYEHGDALPGRELADPTLADDPRLLVTLVAARLHGAQPGHPVIDPGPDRRDLTGRERQRFYRALDRGLRAYGVRADTHTRAVAVPLGLLRRDLLEIGARLAGRGLLARRDDVLHLGPGEAHRALTGGEDQRRLVRGRRGRHARALARPDAAVHGRPPPPRMALPGAARVVERALRRLDDAVPASGSAAVQGLPVSSGTCRGPVRVVLSGADFARVLPGDVLVCPTATPAWSVVAGVAAALVTDTGGPLSHAAVLARELRVPAVVGTGRATARLAEGSTVVVDGTAGTVEVVD